MDISFVIPVKDEEKSIKQLIEEIVKNTTPHTKNFEIIFVDDGSTDKTAQKVKIFAKKNRKVKIVSLRRHFGKSVALSVGFEKAKGDIIFTLDGDLQDNPIEIPRFIKKIDSGYDLVSGWKKNRLDPISRTLPSKVFNIITSRLTGLKMKDFNSGFKAYKKHVAKSLDLYGELYRFIPTLINQQGYSIAEIPVKHRKRKYGKSKYGWTRFIRGLLDLITIVFLTGYSSRPGHFFGTLGIILFIPGFIIGLYITYLRITTGGISYRYPLLFLGVLLILAGVQLVSTGLVAEMIAKNNKQPNEDRINKSK